MRKRMLRRKRSSGANVNGMRPAGVGRGRDLWICMRPSARAASEDRRSPNSSPKKKSAPAKIGKRRLINIPSLLAYIDSRATGRWRRRPKARGRVGSLVGAGRPCNRADSDGASPASIAP